VNLGKGRARKKEKTRGEEKRWTTQETVHQNWQGRPAAVDKKLLGKKKGAQVRVSGPANGKREGGVGGEANQLRLPVGYGACVGKQEKIPQRTVPCEKESPAHGGTENAREPATSTREHPASGVTGRWEKRAVAGEKKRT